MWPRPTRRCRGARRLHRRPLSRWRRCRLHRPPSSASSSVVGITALLSIVGITESLSSSLSIVCVMVALSATASSSSLSVSWRRCLRCRLHRHLGGVQWRRRAHNNTAKTGALLFGGLLHLLFCARCTFMTCRNWRGITAPAATTTATSAATPATTTTATGPTASREKYLV